MFKFVFLRHPFERLVSAFFDKFVQDTDQNFVSSVVMPLPEFQFFMKIINWTKKISFKRFVTFVLSELEKGSISHGTFHWMPFSDFCGMCHVHYSFVGKIETLAEDLKMLEQYFPEKFRDKLAEIFSSKQNASTGKSNKTVEKYFKQLPKKLILKLYDAYKQDFLIGDYPFPEYYVNLGQ